MITAVLLTIVILSVFTALGMACAVAFALRPNAGIGRRRDTPADPFLVAFGDMPGFSRWQLEAMAQTAMRNAARDPLRRSFAVRGLLHRRPYGGGDCTRCGAPLGSPAECVPDPFRSTGLALRPDADSGGLLFPSGPAAVRLFRATPWERGHG